MNQSDLGSVGFGIFTVRCPNTECNKTYLRARLTSSDFYNGSNHEGSIKETWQLLPESSAKILPEYIPKAILQDYLEACRIKDLSAKASATLARRALQGMIRDFWEITGKKTLKDEVDAIEGKVDSDTWNAIEAVRSVGNIGAHMERDIDLIIDIDPEEAQLLVELIETLVEDWYVSRQKRKERTNKVATLAQEKKNERDGGN